MTEELGQASRCRFAEAVAALKGIRQVWAADPDQIGQTLLAQPQGWLEGAGCHRDMAGHDPARIAVNLHGPGRGQGRRWRLFGWHGLG